MFCMRWVIDLQETGNQDILWESGTCEEDSEHFSTCVSTVQQNMTNTFVSMHPVPHAFFLQFRFLGSMSAMLAPYDGRLDMGHGALADRLSSSGGDSR